MNSIFGVEQFPLHEGMMQPEPLVLLLKVYPLDVEVPFLCEFFHKVKDLF